MEVVLARISGWDGTFVIGVFSTKEKAYEASVGYLLKNSGELNSEIEKPVREEDFEHGWIYDITNTHDSLLLTKCTIDGEF